MAWKDTKLYSTLSMKCPKCHSGDLFVKRNAYDLKNVGKMHSACKHCGENFLREPGYYFGAAYVSYAVTVALWVALLVALITFDALGWIEYGFYTHPMTLLITGIVFLIILLPLIYRVSRSIWINMFVRYDRTKRD